MTTPLASLTASAPSWGAKLAFGEPIAAGGYEVVPAALVIFGFGGGGGSGSWPKNGDASAGEGEGSGGGGGGYALPIGAYVTGPRGARFRPNPVAMVMAAAPLVSALGWAVARIITAAKSARPRGAPGRPPPTGVEAALDIPAVIVERGPGRLSGGVNDRLASDPIPAPPRTTLDHTTQGWGRT